MKIAVIGCGSIGQRHIRNLVDIKAGGVLAFDIDRNRLLQTEKISSSIQVFNNFTAMLNERPQAVVIATPTCLHTKYALEAAEAGVHLFIEKPLSNRTGADVEKLIKVVIKNRLVSFIGYNLRYNDSILKIRELLQKKAAGRIISGRTHFGSYLPQRHPRRNYRLEYGAKKSLGGGVLLDTLSHHIDYLIFLFGKPKELLCDMGKKSSLDIDVEDMAEILLRFSGNKVISLHGDSIQRPYKHTIELIGEKGTIFCDIFAAEVRYYNVRKKQWSIYRYGKDLNNMYIREIQNFIACVKGKPLPHVDIKDGKEELGILAKARESAKNKKWVSL
jgi:predicted dehydrogenase